MNPFVEYIKSISGMTEVATEILDSEHGENKNFKIDLFGGYYARVIPLYKEEITDINLGYIISIFDIHGNFASKKTIGLHSDFDLERFLSKNYGLELIASLPTICNTVKYGEFPKIEALTRVCSIVDTSDPVGNWDVA